MNVEIAGSQQGLPEAVRAGERSRKHDQGQEHRPENAAHRPHAGDEVRASAQTDGETTVFPDFRRVAAAAKRAVAESPIFNLRSLTPLSMYRNLRQCVDDLEATGQLRRIDAPVDPNLEAAEIQRRVFRAGGPALLLDERRRLPVPDALQPVRHDGADAIHLPRFVGTAEATRRAAGRSGRFDAAAAAVLERPVVGAV